MGESGPGGRANTESCPRSSGSKLQVSKLFGARATKQDTQHHRNCLASTSLVVCSQKLHILQTVKNVGCSSVIEITPSVGPVPYLLEKRSRKSSGPNWTSTKSRSCKSLNVSGEVNLMPLSEKDGKGRPKIYLAAPKQHFSLVLVSVRVFFLSVSINVSHVFSPHILLYFLFCPYNFIQKHTFQHVLIGDDWSQVLRTQERD